MILDKYGLLIRGSYNDHTQGPGFSFGARPAGGGGGRKILCARSHITSAKPKVPYGRGPVLPELPEPLKVADPICRYPQTSQNYARMKNILLSGPSEGGGVRWVRPHPGGGGGTQIWFRRGCAAEAPNQYLSLRVILAEKGTYY